MVEQLSSLRKQYMVDIIDSVNSLFANLESTVRDLQKKSEAAAAASVSHAKVVAPVPAPAALPNQQLTDLLARFEKMETTLQSFINKKNIIVQTVETAYHGMPPLEFVNPHTSKDDISEPEEAIEAKCEGSVDEEAEAATEDVEDDAEFTQMEVDGSTYYLDKENNVYKETDEGYEQIGTYDPESGELSLDDDEEESASEAVETEEFVYKGKTYYRDAENTVYDEDGDVIGMWTGTKIVASS
jgi:hypothetical protein